MALGFHSGGGQGAGLHFVGLGHDDLVGQAGFVHQIHQRLVGVLGADIGIDQQQDHVRVRRPAPGGRHHGAVETAAWREDAGRIDEDELGSAFHGDAEHPCPGGLDLR